MMKITRVNCIIDKAMVTRNPAYHPWYHNSHYLVQSLNNDATISLSSDYCLDSRVTIFESRYTRRRKMREQVRNTAPDNICRFITHVGKSNARVAHKEREALSISSYCSSFSSWPTISPPSPTYLPAWMEKKKKRKREKKKEKDRAINILSPPLSSRTIVGPPSADHSSTDDISINPLRGGDKVSLKARYSPWPVPRPVSAVSFECLAFRDRVHKYQDERPIGEFREASRNTNQSGLSVLIFYFENDW